MDKRISVISIIVYERDQAAKVNAVLHEYADYIIGRMGLPYEEEGCFYHIRRYGCADVVYQCAFRQIRDDRWCDCEMQHC